MRSLYLIGAPGVGKSTAMAALTDRWGRPETVETPVPHLQWGAPGHRVVEVGRRRGEFSGTDALGYAVVPSAVSWVLSEQRPAVLVGEGDRLACRPFLDALAAVGELTVAYLDGPPWWAYDRMLRRAERLGRRPQSESWWRGRLTKCERLAEAYGAERVNARQTVEAVRDDLRALLGVI